MALLLPVGTAEQAHTTPTQEQYIWANYHPKQVQQALQHRARILEGVDRETLLRDIAAQRKQEHGLIFKLLPHFRLFQQAGLLCIIV